MSPLPHGRVVWLTGRPASGKTTLAKGLLEVLRQRGVPTLWLDSDDLRDVLTPQATYADDERARFYGAIGHLARLGAEGGVTVVVSATANKREFRDRVRVVVPRFYEVWLTCDRDELRKRDIKGLYEKSIEGAITNLPGVGAEYEAPAHAELVLDSGKLSSEEMVAQLLAALS